MGGHRNRSITNKAINYARRNPKKVKGLLMAIIGFAAKALRRRKSRRYH